MEISNFKKVLILPGVSGNTSMLYDGLMCINYQMCGGYYHTIIHGHVGPLSIK